MNSYSDKLHQRLLKHRFALPAKQIFGRTNFCHNDPQRYEKCHNHTRNCKVDLPGTMLKQKSQSCPRDKYSYIAGSRHHRRYQLTVFNRKSIGKQPQKYAPEDGLAKPIGCPYKGNADIGRRYGNQKIGCRGHYRG